MAAILYFFKSISQSSCLGSSESSSSDSESPTSKLLNGEQSTYHSVAPASNNPQLSQAPAVVTQAVEERFPTVTVPQQPQPQTNVARSLPGEASSDEEATPVGYKHVYAPAITQDRVASPAVLPQRSNPFNDTDGFEHSLERPASTNPFDEDTAPRSNRAPSFNPFE